MSKKEVDASRHHASVPPIRDIPIQRRDAVLRITSLLEHEVPKATEKVSSVKKYTSRAYVSRRSCKVEINKGRQLPVTLVRKRLVSDIGDGLFHITAYRIKVAEICR